MKQFSGLLAATTISLMLLSSTSAFAQTAVDQTTINTGDILNPVFIRLNQNGTLGIGTSVSATTTGAASQVSVSGVGIGGTGSFANAPNGGFGTVSQSARNLGTTTNLGAILLRRNTRLGVGASISTNATGATSAMSASGIQGNNFSPLSAGVVTQSAVNGPNATVRNNTWMVTRGVRLTGNGSSVSTSAVGASSAISGNFVNANTSAPRNPDNIALGWTVASASQTATNTGRVTNRLAAFARRLVIGNLVGTGTSVSLSATGASAGFNGLSIAGDDLKIAATRGVVQNATNGGSVNNLNLPGQTIRIGTLRGDGASLQISAIGASASISANGINAGTVEFNTGVAAQTATNNGAVRNMDTVFNTVRTDNLNGIGTSVQVAAIGASAAIDAGTINGGTVLFQASTTITQSATNNAAVSNMFGPGNLVSVGNLNGIASAVQVSAAGASAAVNLSSINGGAITANLVGGSITQTARNTTNGTITNSGIINAGNISGIGSAVSVTAVGASSSVAVSSIASGRITGGNLRIGGITQTSTNNAAVTNVVGIRAGIPTGVGSSISGSAIGASSVVSFSTISGR